MLTLRALQRSSDRLESLPYFDELNDDVHELVAEYLDGRIGHHYSVHPLDLWCGDHTWHEENGEAIDAASYVQERIKNHVRSFVTLYSQRAQSINVHTLIGRIPAEIETINIEFTESKSGNSSYEIEAGGELIMDTNDETLSEEARKQRFIDELAMDLTYFPKQCSIRLHLQCHIPLRLAMKWHMPFYLNLGPRDGMPGMPPVDMHLNQLLGGLLKVDLIPDTPGGFLRLATVEYGASQYQTLTANHREFTLEASISFEPLEGEEDEKMDNRQNFNETTTPYPLKRSSDRLEPLPYIDELDIMGVSSIVPEYLGGRVGHHYMLQPLDIWSGDHIWRQDNGETVDASACVQEQIKTYLHSFIDLYSQPVLSFQVYTEVGILKALVEEVNFEFFVDYTKRANLYTITEARKLDMRVNGTTNRNVSKQDFVNALSADLTNQLKQCVINLFIECEIPPQVAEKHHLQLHSRFTSQNVGAPEAQRVLPHTFGSKFTSSLLPDLPHGLFQINKNQWDVYYWDLVASSHSYKIRVELSN